MSDHDREMADLRASQTRLEASQEKTEKTLRRAIRLSVRDARRQRTRNAEFEENMTRLAAAQLITEEKLADAGVKLTGLGATVEAFITSMRKGGNGRKP